MSKYFFNVVLNGQPTVDGKGRHFADDSVARTMPATSLCC